MVVGAQLGHVFALTDGVHVLGRTSEADIRLAYSSVSRAHAKIHALAGQDYEIEDLGSRNGTRVNGVPLRGRCRLRSGDRIQVGSRVLLQFSVVDQIDRRLREVERLETIGRLSAAVNHDLNNLLSVLTCGLSHLSSLDPSTPLGAAEVVECVQDMGIAASKAGELTHRLNTLVRRPNAAVQESVNVSELCDEVARMVKRTLPDGITLEAQIEPNLWVDGNRAWLHQLLMNPCINARDAISGEPRALRAASRRAHC
jgi:signal transduction histidine kinase